MTAIEHVAKALEAVHSVGLVAPVKRILTVPQREIREIARLFIQLEWELFGAEEMAIALRNDIAAAGARNARKLVVEATNALHAEQLREIRGEVANAAE